MEASVWAFYYIQGEDGEDRSHPNAFKIPLPSGGAASDVTLADVHRHFPLPHAAAAFHFRFRLNAKTGAGGSTFFWLDVAAPAQKVPLVNGRVICKLLRLERPVRKGLVFRRKPAVLWAGGKGEQASTVQPMARQQHKSQHRAADAGAGSVNANAGAAPPGESSPFHRSASAPGFDQGRPAKHADEPRPRAGKAKSSSGGSGSSSRTGSGSAAKVEQTAEPESFEDFLSGGQASSGSAAKPAARDVNLMNDSAWSDAPTTPKKSANSFLDSMDPLAQANNTGGQSGGGRGSSGSVGQGGAAQPEVKRTFEDDGGQTVGPVTMAEMKQHAKSTSDGSNVYNPNLVDKSTKSESVRRAMEERERQVRADVEKARDELRQRDEAARAMSAMKESAGVVLGPQLKAWAEDNGRVKNIRTLLSTMHQVMWDGSKWAEVNMGKLINPPDVKKFYRKAMIVVHPDKSGGRNAEQLLIAERVFAALNTAWDEFAKTNPC